MASPEVSALSRRERRKLEVRNRILEAAVGLFDARGFADTKIAEICERADVAHKTLFNHFASKQDLLRELAQAALGSLLADIEAARKTPGSTRERLRFFFERIADNAEEAGPLRRELLSEMVHTAHEAGTEPEQARKLHEAFGALLREGRAAGELSREHSVQTQTEMLLGAFYALMFNWANLEGYPLRRQALAAARFLGDALCPSAARTRA